MQRIVSRQACACGVGDRPVLDPEAHVPYDKKAETAPLGTKYLDRVFTPLS